MIKRISLFVLVFILIVLPLGKISFAQDSLRSVSISYNMVQGCINEQSLHFEVSPFKHHAFGCSIGLVVENPVFDPLIISPSQNTNPGTVYSGTVYRLSYSYIFSKTPSFNYYIRAQYIYKDMYYNNKEFRDGGDTHVDYYRNEKATVNGADLIFGFNRYRSLNKYLSVCFNVYSGFGWRERHREIETYSIRWYGGGGGPNVNYPPELGNETLNQSFTVPIRGFNIGLKIRI